MVLERGHDKVALVAADLGAISGGVADEVTQRLQSRGFGIDDVLISATHTHSGPTGYFPYTYFNRVYPSPKNLPEFDLAGEVDPQLYGFLIGRLTLAVIRADDDLAPAVAGWGTSQLSGLTANRSLEAHLANHGIQRARGRGKVADDPHGYNHTIDPRVRVLRVDKVLDGESVPVGAWSSFAAHATVNPPSFQYYTADYYGAAERVLEQMMRRAGGTPPGQTVTNVFGGGTGGDVSAALVRRGPAWAGEVGTQVAHSMFRAWRDAGSRLSATLDLGTRSTTVCFCGQQVSGGRVSDTASLGTPQLTGSEEGRGPLHAITGIPLEGTRLPVPVGEQGTKVEASTVAGQVPQVVPLSVVRLGDRLVVTIPGEMTSGMGRRVMATVRAKARDHGIRDVVVSTYTNEYAYYFTTPQEYTTQHYEGAATLYGTHSSALLRDTLVVLARRLLNGSPAPAPADSDPTNGVVPDFTPFDLGAARGAVLEQPQPVERLQRASFRWRGGQNGLDRPLDRAFVSVQTRAGDRWATVDDDLGLNMLWRVEEGNHTAWWEVPLDARQGSYRFVVTANRYRLASTPFEIRPSTRMEPVVASNEDGRLAVRLAYPAALPSVDLTTRPTHARAGSLVVLIDGRRRSLTTSNGLFILNAGQVSSVVVPAGGARDQDGNRNARAVSLIGDD